MTDRKLLSGNEKKLYDTLTEKLNAFQTSPFLFIGSGISRRYLNLEDWKGLLKKFCIGVNDFEYYYSTAEGSLPKVASLIANDFHEIWWDDPEYIESRSTYKSVVNSKSDALKIEISKYFNSLDEYSSSLEEEIEIFKSANIDGIITTNWDLFLESLFPDFRTFVGQKELLFSSPQAIAEIYKIHGCCTEPKSMVLTSNDYKNFNDKNAYLAAKLLTFFLEHPIFFFGYSLSDQNILQIVESILKCLGSDNINRLQQSLFFVQRTNSKDEIGVHESILSIEGLNIPISIVKADSFSPVYLSFHNSKRRLPARTLRYCKEQLYNIVKSNDPKQRIFVLDIDDSTDLEDVEFVIGVGAIENQFTNVGYETIKVKNIIKDVLFDNQNFQAKALLEKTIPALLKRSKYVPFYKYLSTLKIISEQQLVESNFQLDKGLDVNFTEYYVNKGERKRNFETIKNLSIKQISKNYQPEEAIKLITVMDRDSINIDELESFLKSNFDLYEHEDSFVSLAFKKAVCLYDRLKYSWRF